MASPPATSFKEMEKTLTLIHMEIRNSTEHLRKELDIHFEYVKQMKKKQDAEILDLKVQCAKLKRIITGDQDSEVLNLD